MELLRFKFGCNSVPLSALDEQQQQQKLTVQLKISY